MDRQRTPCDDCQHLKLCRMIRHWKEQVDNINAEIHSLDQRRAQLLIDIDSNEKLKTGCKIGKV